MNFYFSIIIFFIFLTIMMIVFNRIFRDDIAKVMKVIEYFFVPFSLFIWIIEIVIGRKVVLSQFGSIYTISSFIVLILVWILYRLQNKAGSATKGRLIGTVYAFVFALILLGFVLGSGFIDTYIYKHCSYP